MYGSLRIKGSYYAWEKRPESNRTKLNKILLKKIQDIHEKSNKVYGSTKIMKKLTTKISQPINHKRVERLMSENCIRSKVSRKFKATTYSGDKLPVAENLLNRDFIADKPNEKMVSDITYLWTYEGWLRPTPLPP